MVLITSGITLEKFGPGSNQLFKVYHQGAIYLNHNFGKVLPTKQSTFPKLKTHDAICSGVNFGKVSKMIRELNTEDYQNDFSEGMRNVTGLNNSGVDIWPYVSELVEEKIVSAQIGEQQLVEIVYQNDAGTLHHILLPHDKKNIFIVVLVDLQQQSIAGHYRLDLNDVYGVE